MKYSYLPLGASSGTITCSRCSFAETSMQNLGKRRIPAEIQRKGKGLSLRASPYDDVLLPHDQLVRRASDLPVLGIELDLTDMFFNFLHLPLLLTFIFAPARGRFSLLSRAFRGLAYELPELRIPDHAGQVGVGLEVGGCPPGSHKPRRSRKGLRPHSQMLVDEDGFFEDELRGRRHRRASSSSARASPPRPA